MATSTSRRKWLGTTLSSLALALLTQTSLAAEPFKIGLVLPMSGPFASTGKQIEAAVRLYQQDHGDTVAGRKIEVIIKDDGGTQPDVSKRLSQELVLKDKVQVLAGFGLTPLALASAPVATQAKVPMVVMAAATSIIPTKSPYIVRTGFTLPQVTAPMADWAVAHKDLKIKNVITLVTDYGPGIDAERVFISRFTAGGGKIVDSLRTPLQNPDFAPFLQRIKDAKPDAVFIFVPSGIGPALMKQFAERGLTQAGIKLICTGDVLDDADLAVTGPSAVGVISSHHYSAAHDSPENKAYVAGIAKIAGGLRPNFHSVGGYDGMHLIYEALKKTGGDSDGDKLIAAMKGLSWMSPRGPVSIDPATRDIVQNVYFRKVEKVKGAWFNVEFDKVEHVKDPGI
ncbi:MAG TPA: ABC transporter substrate-binding protein [Rhodocyclaceae bacterium]|nr:ABC transporter substrate-binding protein [Rhodocyclaceae bacterium]